MIAQIDGHKWQCGYQYNIIIVRLVIKLLLVTYNNIIQIIYCIGSMDMCMDYIQNK